MSVVVSCYSGAAAEAAAFGVPALFLSAEAATTFERLIALGRASIVRCEDILREIAAATLARGSSFERQPDIESTLLGSKKWRTTIGPLARAARIDGAGDMVSPGHERARRARVFRHLATFTNGIPARAPSTPCFRNVSGLEL